MATLADVAKLAGVGVMSVSRVVNGTRKVSPTTEKKVKEAIRRIGYEPNDAARVLKGHRTRVLGLIVPDLADPFYAVCANAIQEAARDAKYLTWMAASGHKVQVEQHQTDAMIQRQVAGLIIIPMGVENDHFLRAKSAGVPIVALDRPLNNVDTDSVTVNNREASIKLVEHLLAHGHRDILCVTDEEHIFTNLERIAGYTQVMRHANLAVRICMIGPITGTVTDQLPVFLSSKPRPTAIFSTSDLLTLDILRLLQRAHISIPRDLALVAFDEFDAATIVSPQVTVVRQPVADLGFKAFSLLLERLKGSRMGSSQHVVMNTELIIRGSCGCGIPKDNKTKTKPF